METSVGLCRTSGEYVQFAAERDERQKGTRGNGWQLTGMVVQVTT